MGIWEIKNDASLLQDPEWDQLVAKNLGSDPIPARKLGFLLSRSALYEVLKRLSINPKIADLTLEGFHQLPAFPEITLSLTHCKEAGAAIASLKPNVSLGIDVEDVLRPVTDATFQRVSHKEDTILQRIEIWCLKEAALKCLMNSGRFEKTVNFSDIKIEEKKFTHSPSGLSGKWELHYPKTFVVALCELEN
jgi:4'-phosphopantetheinyl transferase EntD